MTEVVELKEKRKTLSFAERILPSDILEARRLNMIKRRIEEAQKSRTKAILIDIVDSSGAVDLIPLPEPDNLEKLFSDFGILERLPESHVAAIMKNIPDDVLDNLLFYTSHLGKSNVYEKIVKLARKYKGGEWP
ncbi:MAG: hypothetical protein DRO23_07275 [Thermoprotei archaeon]|nr:MAG: hypothetical protein DRO23_07275 [Thermoprotei archaeon]